MRVSALNLASEPFTNVRPERRAAITLGVVAIALLAINAVLYRQYLVGSAETRAELREMEARISEERAAIRALHSGLSGSRLEQQNAEVQFLNQRIAYRTFPWSRLFDRFSEVLPAEVRLHSLSPSSQSDRRGRRREDGRVELRISGAARSHEALVAFIDGLFLHPSFAEAKLIAERQERGLLEFELVTFYVAESPPPGAATAAETEPVTSAGRPASVAVAAGTEGVAPETVGPEVAAQVASGPSGARPASGPPPAAAAGRESQEVASRPGRTPRRTVPRSAEGVPPDAPSPDPRAATPEEPVSSRPLASGPPGLRPRGNGR